MSMTFCRPGTTVVRGWRRFGRTGELNNNPFDFARAILLNLRHGPKKGLTMLLVGVTTSGKTWLLLPLTVRRDRERGDRDRAGAR